MADIVNDSGGGDVIATTATQEGTALEPQEAQTATGPALKAGGAEEAAAKVRTLLMVSQRGVMAFVKPAGTALQVPPRKKELGPAMRAGTALQARPRRMEAGRLTFLRHPAQRAGTALQVRPRRKEVGPAQRAGTALQARPRRKEAAPAQRAGTALQVHPRRKEADSAVQAATLL
jgi:hypothetical protein